MSPRRRFTATLYSRWPAALARAIDLAEQHCSRLGCRSLGLLHVSAALVSVVDQFVTADRRQSTVARRGGLLSSEVR